MTNEPLPKLGPRVWWTYLAIAEPTTVSHLADEAGIVTSSMTGHIRTLTSHGLAKQVGPATDPRFVQDRRLTEEQLSSVRAKVERASLAPTPSPATATATVSGHAHNVSVFHPRKSGDSWRTTAQCTCGWREVVTGPDERQVKANARALWQQHSPDSFTRETRGEGLARSAGLLVVAIPIAAVVLLLVVAVRWLASSDGHPDGLDDPKVDWSQQCGTLMTLARDDDQSASDRARALDLYAQHC